VSRPLSLAYSTGGYVEMALRRGQPSSSAWPAHAVRLAGGWPLRRTAHFHIVRRGKPGADSRGSTSAARQVPQLVPVVMMRIGDYYREGKRGGLACMRSWHAAIDAGEAQLETYIDEYVARGRIGARVRASVPLGGRKTGMLKATVMDSIDTYRMNLLPRGRPQAGARLPRVPTLDERDVALRRAPRRRKTAAGMRQDGSAGTQTVRQDQAPNAGLQLDIDEPGTTQ
jgi:hypothetical protein